MFVKNNEMKKILLLLAIGFSTLANGQAIMAERETNDYFLKQSELPENEYYIIVSKTNLKNLMFVGIKLIDGKYTKTVMPDSTYKYVTSNTMYSYYWVKIANNDFTTFYLTQSTFHSIGVLWTTSMRFFYKQPLVIENEYLMSNDANRKYFDLNGREINNPDSYEGVMIVKNGAYSTLTHKSL